jgi:polyphosphate kinase
MFRRIEVAWPVRDPGQRQRVFDEGLVPYLHDRQDAWALGPDGRSTRVAEQGVSAQQALMRLYGWTGWT